MGTLNIGDKFKKVGGDYQFEGEVVVMFTKRNGQQRMVGEDDRGLLFIFDPARVEKICEKS